VGILQRYPHLRWWSRENQGQFATLNEGIRAATGDVLTIISADDRYIAPSAFSRVIAHWRALPQLGLVYGRVRHIDPEGGFLPFETSVEPRGPFSPWMLRHRSCIYHCSMFVKRRHVIDPGVWFDPAFRFLGDWDWISRLLASGVVAGYIDEPLSEYRNHPGQVTNTTREAARSAEARTICERNHASHRVSLLLRRAYALRHKALRLSWLLRTGGPRLVVERLARKLRGRLGAEGIR
jgi:glycosyltransferase involved in cell wall biosynthesis